jgi:hypothetical protein
MSDKMYVMFEPEEEPQYQAAYEVLKDTDLKKFSQQKYLEEQEKLRKEEEKAKERERWEKTHNHNGPRQLSSGEQGRKLIKPAIFVAVVAAIAGMIGYATIPPIGGTQIDPADQKNTAPVTRETPVTDDTAKEPVEHKPGMPLESGYVAYRGNTIYAEGLKYCYDYADSREHTVFNRSFSARLVMAYNDQKVNVYNSNLERTIFSRDAKKAYMTSNSDELFYLENDGKLYRVDLTTFETTVLSENVEDFVILDPGSAGVVEMAITINNGGVCSMGRMHSNGDYQKVLDGKWYMYGFGTSGKVFISDRENTGNFYVCDLAKHESKLITEGGFTYAGGEDLILLQEDSTGDMYYASAYANTHEPVLLSGGRDDAYCYIADFRRPTCIYQEKGNIYGYRHDLLRQQVDFLSYEGGDVITYLVDESGYVWFYTSDKKLHGADRNGQYVLAENIDIRGNELRYDKYFNKCYFISDGVLYGLDRFSKAPEKEAEGVTGFLDVEGRDDSVFYTTESGDAYVIAYPHARPWEGID